MNEKTKLSLVAVASFGMGAASAACYVAWAFTSAFKEINQERLPYRMRRTQRKTVASSENFK